MVKAIFKFESIDSTRDLCDLFAFLFNKGIYQGGRLTADESTNCVYIEPFRLISKDGMHIISDSKITLELNGKDCYVVCKAKYNDNDDPTIEISTKTRQQIDSNSLKDYFVYFGMIRYSSDNSGKITIIYDDIRDVIEPIGKKYKAEQGDS